LIIFFLLFFPPILAEAPFQQAGKAAVHTLPCTGLATILRCLGRDTFLGRCYPGVNIHSLASTWGKVRKMQNLCLRPEKQDFTALCVQGRIFIMAWGITPAPQIRFFLGQVSLPPLQRGEHSCGWATNSTSCRF